MSRRFKPGAVGQYFCEGLWDGPVKEVHSSTCSHCSRLTEFPSLKSMMEYVDICRSCMKLICLECYGKGCTPFIKKIEKQEEELQKKLHRRRLGL